MLGSGSFELTETPSGTSLKYYYEVALSGTIAAVGGRLLRGAARQLINIFLRSLARQAGDMGRVDPMIKVLWFKLKRMVGLN